MFNAVAAIGRALGTLHVLLADLTAA